MPTLVIGEHSFECKPKLPSWQLMELAAAMKSSDPMTQMAGMHDFVLSVIQPDARDGFVAAMRALDDDDADAVESLSEAVGNLMESYSAPDKGAASTRPTRRSSASPSGRTPTGGTSRVEPSQPVTPRVVNLSRGRSVAS